MTINRLLNKHDDSFDIWGNSYMTVSNYQKHKTGKGIMGKFDPDPQHYIFIY